MTQMSSDAGEALGYRRPMSVLASLFRLLMVATFAVGLGLPVSTIGTVHMPMVQSHNMHTDVAPALPMPHDEICRKHCLGVTLLVSIMGPLQHVARVEPIHFASLNKDEPSLWPQPEGRPPRS